MRMKNHRKISNDLKPRQKYQEKMTIFKWAMVIK